MALSPRLPNRLTGQSARTVKPPDITATKNAQTARASAIYSWVRPLPPPFKPALQTRSFAGPAGQTCFFVVRVFRPAFSPELGAQQGRFHSWVLPRRISAPSASLRYLYLFSSFY